MKLPTALLLSLLTPILDVNGAAHEENELTVMKSMHGHSDKILRVLKRQLNCPVGEYHTNVHCCKLCPAGTFKSKDCSQEHGSPDCMPCQDGLYMNTANHEEECHRCTVCDHGEGFEVDQTCTAKENTICQCMEHYFCNATSPCKHCEPCNKCNNGYVKEECTRRKNTVCQDQDPLPDYAIGLIVLGTLLVAAAAAAAVVVYFRCRKRHTLALDQPTLEEAMHLQEDLDLEPYFTDIANNLKLDEMLLFVRKNGISEPIIEQILQDNRQSTHEQKIQLLSCWYQRHGRRGAFSKLKATFEENNYHLTAKKIIEIINSSASSRGASNNVDPDEEHNM